MRQSPEVVLTFKHLESALNTLDIKAKRVTNTIVDLELVTYKDNIIKKFIKIMIAVLERQHFIRKINIRISICNQLVDKGT